MKYTFLIFSFLILIIPCNVVIACGDWNVTWTPVSESIINKEYIIEVQNLQDIKKDVDISSFFAETNFDILKLEDIEFFEWKLIPYIYTINHYNLYNYSEWNASNETWYNKTESILNYTEIIESEKLAWKACISQLFIETSITKKDNYGFINIPKMGSKDTGDGTYNGTKRFLLKFRTPVKKIDNKYGSFGKVAILLDGIEYHPWWNTTWSNRKKIMLTGIGSQSFSNPTEDGYIYDTNTYTRYNAIDHITFGRDESPNSIYRGYIEWDISSLPSDANILNAKLKYHGYLNGYDGHVHEMMDTRPSISGNQDVYNESGEGTIYTDVAGFPVVGSNQEIDLGNDAASDLQTSISNGWFAIGLQSDGETPGMSLSYIYSENYASVMPAPTLYVEYTSISEGGNNQTDYQLLLNVSHEPEMQSDFDDLRFCNETHEIDSWLESKVDDSYALVWVEFPTTPANGVNQTYLMYYGNEWAASDWDGAATFIVFDDFEDALQGDWSTLAGTIDYSNTNHAFNGIQCIKVSASSRTEIPITHSDDIAIRYRLWKKDTAKICYWHSDTNWVAHIRYDNDETIDYYTTSYQSTGNSIVADQWELMESRDFIWASHTHDIIKNDVSIQDNAGMWNYGVRAQNAIEFENLVGDTIYIDDFIVRKYVFNPPIYIFGNEEYYIPPTLMSITNETKLIMSEVSTGLKSINMGNYLIYAFILIGILLIILIIQIINNSINRG